VISVVWLIVIEVLGRRVPQVRRPVTNVAESVPVPEALDPTRDAPTTS
jgi:hypothetical protein